MNDALLLKWSWRFKKEGNSLWKNIIVSCHGSSRPWAMLPCSASASGCWKQIVKVGEQKLPNGELLNSYFVASLGDGSSLNFWGDLWLGDTPLRVRYPNLFNLERDKWVKVSGRVHFEYNVNTLRWNWKREPSSYQELTELFSLLGEIYDVNRQGDSDVWKWKASTDGIFSVSRLESSCLITFQ
ncbi:reverse transcriptase domain, Reverse transcriptase zinc-binding domain protein [Artemisia annua]|uniref:Reverse transcriptase domain, Reverse transcriptase zinc-binding domain protein n=1 Tax=Artemisia annua TaxID=35608 RepID=A0A2U1LS47_ARTAN|nr:reverse transcriptase domain, Reverse transcriptase zinc-binding domain protein [Artemisia annua]